MSDLERLDEALGRYENDDGAVVMPLVAEVFNAARAYRDLLANGERVEPDYGAAYSKYQDIETRPLVMSELEVRWIVDAAIAGRLLVDPNHRGGEMSDYAVPKIIHASTPSKDLKLCSWCMLNPGACDPTTEEER